MEVEADTIITVPIGKTIGQITKEQKLRAKHIGYTTNKTLGNKGVYLTCKKGRETHIIYIKK